MRVQTQFNVAASPQRAWRQLLDTAGLARCLPGFESRPPAANGIHSGQLTIGHNGSEQRGLGRLRAIDADADELTATIGIEGRELAGPAMASGLLSASVTEAAGASRVLLCAEFDVVGHRAGPEVVREDGQRLIDDFAAALERRMSEPAPPVTVEAAVSTQRPRAPEPAPPAHRAGSEAGTEPEALDLGSMLGGGAVKRYGAVGTVLIAVTVFWRVALRRPRRGVSLTIRYRW